jgi:dTDP-4-dehydrorhamnose reductase
VFIDDFVHAIDVLISSDKTGIFHTVGSQTLSPFDAAKMIALNFGLDQSQISSASRADYFAGKAKRPFNLSLKNDKINALGVEMRGFEEGLQEVKRQITNSQ